METRDETTEDVDQREDDASGGGDASAESRARDKEEASKKASEEMKKLEEGDPPEKLEDWPDGPAKYKTYGNDDNEAYGDGVTGKLGPADVKRFEDGSVEIGGEKVDNPEDHKGEPIPGGPTDEKSETPAG